MEIITHFKTFHSFIAYKLSAYFFFHPSHFFVNLLTSLSLHIVLSFCVSVYMLITIYST